jgi:hypothetical protein
MKDLNAHIVPSGLSFKSDGIAKLLYPIDLSAINLARVMSSSKKKKKMINQTCLEGYKQKNYTNQISLYFFFFKKNKINNMKNKYTLIYFLAN